MTELVHHTLTAGREAAASLRASLVSGRIVVSAVLPENPEAERIQVEVRVSGTNAHADSIDLPYVPGDFKPPPMGTPRGISGRRLLLRLLACDRAGRILWQVLDHPVVTGPEGAAALEFAFEPDPDAPPGSAWIADWRERSVLFTGPPDDSILARKGGKEAAAKAWEALLTDVARGDAPEHHPLARRIQKFLEARGLAYEATRSLARWRREAVAAFLSAGFDEEDNR
jgi:hypothetical protein